jgi:hypothetical protein
MKKLLVCLLPAIVLLSAATTTRADQFSDIANSPNTYWVPPSATYAPPSGYYGAYYGPYGPPPVYIYAPPPPPVPHFFFGIHIH